LVEKDTKIHGQFLEFTKSDFEAQKVPRVNKSITRIQLSGDTDLLETNRFVSGLTIL